jgi:hypothetical protein
MTDGAWTDAVRYDPSLASVDRKDPAAQTKARAAYKTFLADALEKKGVEATPDNINKAWVTGAGGLSKIVKNPDAPLDATLGAGVVAINPNLKGKTGAEFLADSDPYSVKGKKAPTSTWIAPETVSADGVIATREPSTVVTEEMRTLQKFMENPGTPASERGKARLKLAELKAAQGHATMPALERNYAGQELQAPGQSAQPGARVSTAPAVDAPKMVVKPIGKSIDVARQKVTEVKVDDVAPALETQEERAAKLDGTLNQGHVRESLSALEWADQQNFPQGGDSEDRRNFLEQGLAEIYGPTGMFDKKDLIRFAVLTAGGLLTGGSTAGSIRYAGLDTLRHSDARRQAEAAEARAQATAQAAMQKELRADLRRMDSEAIKALDKKTPDVQATAVGWMNQAKKLEQQGKYEQSRELYRRANMLLTASPDLDKTGAGADANGVKDYETGFYQNQPATMRKSKDGRMLEVFPSNGKSWVPIQDPNEFETDTAHQRNYESLLKSTRDQLEPKLRKLYGPKGAGDAEAQSKDLAQKFSALKAEMGRHVPPAEFGRMAEMTIAGLKPEDIQDGRINGEALRKSFYLNSVMMLRKGDIDLFRNPKGEVDLRANAAFKDDLVALVDKNKKRDPSYGVHQAADEIIGKWNELPDATRKRYEKTADGRVGMTGFLRWVEDQREKK